MSIVLDGSGITIDKIVQIARFNEKVELSDKSLERIKICRAMLEKKIEAKEIMYGVNTGIGEFSEVVLNDDQVKDFQKYLIYNHSAGIGEPMSIEHVRGAIAGRINARRPGVHDIRRWRGRSHRPRLQNLKGLHRPGTNHFRSGRISRPYRPSTCCGG